MRLVQEGAAKLYAPEGKLTKKLSVFYNPVMWANRESMLLLFKAIGRSGSFPLPRKVGLALAGTGVRGIRLSLEAGLSEVLMNDISPKAFELMQKNVKLNEAPGIGCSCMDANEFIRKNRPFDYLDIDPFGSPNPFLDAAISSLGKRGILALTATDTAPLSGTYPAACRRKYWAEPCRDSNMHETGLRILIRKVQLIGAQYDIALLPLYSFYREHYFRIYLVSERSKKAADAILAMHSVSGSTGPLFMGNLWDTEIAEQMYHANKIPKLNSFLLTIAEESRIGSAGFFDLHQMSKKHKLENPRKIKVIEELKSRGHKASGTHFRPTGIRTDASEKGFIAAINRSLA